MPVYKNKKCILCGEEYTPLSPKQKYCVGCKKEGKKIASRANDRKRNRERRNYVERDRKCICCGITFKTHYSKKIYCGSIECEAYRINLKNHNTHLKRDRSKLIEKGRKYYALNREKCLLSKAGKYREINPNATEYTPGKLHRHNIAFVKEYVARIGYELLSSEYVNNNKNILLKCPSGHQWETSFHNFKDGGARCFQCYLNNNYTSRFEIEVRNFISDIYDGAIIFNDRTRIKNPFTNKYLELDIYLPGINKAVECNGVYWHSTEGAALRDMIKKEQCDIKGIDLLTITDEEWFRGDGKELLIYFMDTNINI